MLAGLIAFSLRHPVMVIIAGGLLVLVAGLTSSGMPVDVFPELNAPTVVVMTEAGGLAADEVESQVTFPIETSVNGIPGVRRIRSSSAMSLSLVWVEFDWGVDIFRARQLVSERLSAARDALPPDAHAEMTPVTSITGEVMLVALSSPDGRASPMELRDFAEFELRNRLLAVPGVAQVVAIGGHLPEYQVLADQDRLALHGVTMEELAAAVRSANSTASAGYLSNVDRLEIPVRQEARVTAPRDIASTMIRFVDGAPVVVGDVAEVRLGPAPSRGAAADRGAPAVVVSVQKSPGVNTLALTESLDRALDEVEARMPSGMTMNRDPFRAARFIERSVRNVVKVLIEACVIVAVILVLFLLNARATLITLTALPLSLAVSLLILWAAGFSVNVMTLGGLAVAIGELVDDAIIDVENVLRRLRQNRQLPVDQRRGVTEVVYAASNEIRSSVVFATIIICMVFVPLLFLQGLEGRFFRPLGVAYITSILASLLVALTVTPALCRLLFARFGAGRPVHDDRAGGHDGFLVRWLKRRYGPLLRSALRHPRLVFGTAGLMAAGSLLLASTFGTSFLPAFKEGTFTVFLMAPPGTSLEESGRLASGIERRLTGIEGVSSVTRRTGRAERDEHAEPVSSSEIEVTVRPDADQDMVRRAIDAVLSDAPGVVTMIGQPIEHRLSHVLSGTPAAVAINIYGDDLGRLRSIAQRIATALKKVPGATDVAANREVMITSLPIRYRPELLASAGLSPADAATQVQRALYGERVGEVAQGSRRYDMIVRLDESRRRRIDQVEDLRLVGRAPATVRLGDVADLGPERTSNLITREDGRRKAVVSVNVAEGSNLGDLVHEVRKRVDPLVREAGLSVHYGGQFEAQRSASRTIRLMGAGVAVVMFLLLRASTGSARVALLVMLNLPLALIGGVVAIYVSESPSVPANTAALFGLGGAYAAPVVSVASLVGFVTLFGIAVRNGILLVNHYRHLESVERCAPGQAVVRGSMERLVPILMTALTAALGLIPLALAADRPGSELLAPLAVVVLGGLVSSTLLNLFVVPAGYALLRRARPS